MRLLRITYYCTQRDCEERARQSSTGDVQGSNHPSLELVLWVGDCDLNRINAALWICGWSNRGHSSVKCFWKDVSRDDLSLAEFDLGHCIIGNAENGPNRPCVGNREAARGRTN